MRIVKGETPLTILVLVVKRKHPKFYFFVISVVYGKEPEDTKD